MRANPNRHVHRPPAPGLALILLALWAPSLPGCAAAAPRGAGQAAEAVAPRWPLDLPARWLTSNFMEHRGGRFHAGIDLKTREREGFPAYAVEDGWIERVRATPGGYGRALYLRAAGGRTYVYAHLARFSDEIERLVAARQAADGRYRVDIELAPGEAPVARGQAVGLTGQSGTAGPHLHFEVRDAAGRPLDPLATGFAVRDTIAPVIGHVRAVAADASARLAGGATSARLAVNGGAGAAAASLRVTGPVAFSAGVVEATDPAGHRLEPWRLELSLDGRVVYRRDNETFDFVDNAQQRLEWLETGALREQWLHRHPAVTVPGREGDLWYAGPDGAGLPPGRHRFELRAVDRAGNRALAAWDLEVLSAGEEPGPAGGGWEPQAVHVEVAVNAGDTIVLAPLFDVVPEGAREFVTRLGPGAGQPLLAKTAVATVPGDWPDAAQTAQAARQGLAPLGRCVTWAAAAWPAAGDVVVDLPHGVAPPEAGLDARLYRWDGEAWLPAGPPLGVSAPGGPAWFELGRPGTYAALADTAAPVIDGGALRAGPHPGWGTPVAGLTPPRWETLAVAVRDGGAGVDPVSLRALWDGRPLVVEPDLPRDRVLVHVPDDAAAGAHVLELEVADAAGRGARRAIAVECVPGPRAPGR